MAEIKDGFGDVLKELQERHAKEEANPFKATIKEVSKEAIKEYESEKQKKRDTEKEQRKKDKEIKQQIKEVMDNTTKISFVADNKCKVICEQIYDSETKKSRYVIYDSNTKEVTYSDHYGCEFYPVNNEAITEQAVLLPTAIEKFDDVPALIKEIQDFIHKYLDVSPVFEKFGTYYILLSWLYDRVNTMPILRVLGDTGAGKSRALDVIGKLCYKPMLVAGALNPAPIFRLIKMFKGTLIVEEADLSKARQQSDETQAIIKIFNCGFEKQKPVVRCNPNDVTELNFFDVYGPKMLATRQRFDDQATESRCLTEVMQQTTRNNIPTNLLDEFYEAQAKLRNKLLWFRLIKYFDFKPQVLILQDMAIEPRLKQAFEAFASIFGNVPETLAEFKTFLIGYQKDIIDERAQSFDGQIVNHLIDLVDSGQEVITSKDIAELMGGDIKPATISKRLKVFGINIKVTRQLNKLQRVIDYDIEQINKLRKRYVTDVTNVTLGGEAPPVAGFIEDK